MHEEPRTDPIVDEVRKHRQELLLRAGGNLDALCDMLEDRQEHRPGGTVRLPPRRVDPAGPDGAASDAA